MPPAPPALTGQELEIMKIVWRLGPASVRQVHEELLAHRKIAYTTVMTLMTILQRKGHLKRKLAGRAYVYQPTRQKRQVMRGMVKEFLDRVFNGSAEPLLLHLVEDEQLSAEDLEEIARTMRRRTP